MSSLSQFLGVSVPSHGRKTNFAIPQLDNSRKEVLGEFTLETGNPFGRPWANIFRLIVRLCINTAK